MDGCGCMRVLGRQHTPMGLVSERVIVWHYVSLCVIMCHNVSLCVIVCHSVHTCILTYTQQMRARVPHCRRSQRVPLRAAYACPPGVAALSFQKHTVGVLMEPSLHPSTPPMCLTVGAVRPLSSPCRLRYLGPLLRRPLCMLVVVVLTGRPSLLQHLAGGVVGGWCLSV